MKNLKNSKKKGFSLVELLVVIAVIGVIAAIAIPAMSGIFGRADSTKTARNAQNLVSTFNDARAAGNQVPYADAAAAIAGITTSPGLTGSGTFATSRFFVSMDPTEKAAATALINGTLTGSATEGTLSITN